MLASDLWQADAIRANFSVEVFMGSTHGIPTKAKRIGKKTDFVTKYAMTSPDEDAAETGAAYMTNTLALWKKAIDNNSATLMHKARVIEELFTDGKTCTFNSISKTFKIPVDRVERFFEDATRAIRGGARLTEVEALLMKDYGQYAEDFLQPDPRVYHLFSRRVVSSIGFGLVACGMAAIFLCFGSLAYLIGLRTWYFAVAALMIFVLGLVRVAGRARESAYMQTLFYAPTFLDGSLLTGCLLSAWLGGWLLAHKHILTFRGVACIPALLIAMIASRWILAAPDSKDESGQLKLSARSTVIGVYLALLSFSFTVASVLISELLGK